MGSIFLQEVDATVLVVDVRDFEVLAEQLGPVELGVALGRFYDHVGAVVAAHRGRVVKFIGDGVLAVFIGGAGIDHRARALAAVGALVGGRQAFLDENAAHRLPLLDYAVAVASGHLLAGELGTDTLRLFDILGKPVNQAFRLNALAARRGASNLVSADTWEGVSEPNRAARPAAVETDLVELGAEKLRLFRVESPAA